MLQLRNSLFAAFAVLALGVPPAGAVLVRDHRNESVQGDAFEVDPGVLVDIAVPLVKGRTVTFLTGDLSPGGDPMLHLLLPVNGLDGSVQEVARDDDSGGNRNARLTFTPTVTATFRLVLHATSAAGRGTCSLRRDGNLLFGSVPFGGALRIYRNLRPREILSTVPLPNGLADFPALYLLTNAGQMVRRHTGNLSASFALGQTIPEALVLVGKSVPLLPAGPVRLVRNDGFLAGHDSDLDRLGDELELSVGTCSGSTQIRVGWECDRGVDLRDTDGDGISDGDELLGRMDERSPDPFLLLPLWGADPRHKDVFIEVDYGRQSLDDPDRRMRPEVARAMAAAYAETDVDLTPIDALLHAQLLGNPDGRPGVRLHLDTGVSPEGPQDATLYGDWGGHDAVSPVCDANGCRALPLAEAYAGQMSSVRKGIFHYNSSYSGSGGQCAVGIACSWSHDDPFTAIHEFGHTLTLNHYGPTSDRPEANCKVSYPSVMSYAILAGEPFVFSDGFGRPGFNNVAAAEAGAVRGPTAPRGRALLERLRDLYGYAVDLAAGSVDWNRDGIFQAGAVPAYTNSFAGSGCEFTSSNRIPLDAATLHAPALARFLGRVFLFYRTAADRIEVQVSSVDPFHCQPGGTPGCGSTAFTRFTIERPWNQGIVALTAQAVVDAEVPKLLLFFTDSSGALFETSLTALIPPAFADPQRVPVARTVAEEFSTTGAADHVFLVYKDPGGKLFLKQRANRTWGADIAVSSSPFLAFPTVPAGASPAIFETPDRTLFGAFARPDLGGGPGFQVWRFNPANNQWGSPDFLDLPAFILGKPAFAWRALPAGSPLPGRLYLYWTPRDGDRPGPLLESWLVRQPDGTVDMSYSMNHSNTSFFARGVAALSEPGVDDNVRLAVAFAVENPGVAVPDGTLEIRPKADGIVDLAQVDRDDWEAMGRGLCQVLTREQAAPPIRCAP